MDFYYHDRYSLYMLCIRVANLEALGNVNIIFIVFSL